MKKILIIPSWYPTEKKPIEGSFFQEQALAMTQLYDIRIFYPQIIKSNRLLRLYNSILFILRLKPSIEFIKNNFANNPGKYSFNFRKGIGRLNLDEKMLEWHCNAAFNSIIETGWRPDLIHAQCTKIGGIISYFISKKYNIPYIITEHNVFLLYSYTAKIQALIRLALENSKFVLSVSEHQKRMILMHGIRCHPLVVGNMVDEDVFKIVLKANRIFTILYISFDSYIKDNETFFKAVKMFQQKAKGSFIIKLLGRSQNIDRPNPFTLMVNDYKLENYIEIIEYVGRDKIVNFFQNADVLVSTSIAETFGVSMCEALFCGVPIISTANGGVDDMINDKNGIKVKIQDADAICDALLKIFKKEIIFDPQEIRCSVVNKFSKQVFLDKMDKIYCSSLSNK